MDGLWHIAYGRWRMTCDKWRMGILYEPYAISRLPVF